MKRTGCNKAPCPPSPAPALLFLILSHLRNVFRHSLSYPALTSTGDPSPLAAPQPSGRGERGCHFTHLCLDHRPLPLDSCMEYRCQKVPVWPNLFCNQKHIPGRTVPCTQQDTHIVPPRVLGFQRRGGLKPGSRCQGSQYLQEKNRLEVASGMEGPGI